MIELDKLTKSFPQKDGTEVRAVNSVSLTVPSGEICVFLGPSGCGGRTGSSVAGPGVGAGAGVGVAPPWPLACRRCW